MENARRFRPCKSSILTLSGFVLLGSLPTKVPVVSGQVHPRVGDKVRVTAPGQGLVKAVGVVREMGEESLGIDLGGSAGLVPVRLGQVEAIDVTFSQGSHQGIGAVVGLLAGGALGAVVGYNRGNSTCGAEEFASSLCLSTRRGAKSAVGGLIGAGVGGGFGALLGRSIKTDRWVPATVRDHGLSLAPTLTSSGSGMALRISF